MNPIRSIMPTFPRSLRFCPPHNASRVFRQEDEPPYRYGQAAHPSTVEKDRTTLPPSKRRLLTRGRAGFLLIGESTAGKLMHLAELPCSNHGAGDRPLTQSSVHASIPEESTRVSGQGTLRVPCLLVVLAPSHPVFLSRQPAVATTRAAPVLDRSR